ncbi:bifunctional heptose 7-phosphate kinase/heptose 1-phosphate adenyltransferase [Paenibacillus sp. GbtcB18]|uniref:bifunctional heptose 7-phosphate kinase/heptose 1-phosphate adenyltransferase n=1 Tax=Paenibacillus sp. GbtcB18 TaxID=2824763 RepID=UPI001C30449B|nr:PfkB family carbohydrate kinase [Paenibacillus sp. GbtcB18]
MERSCKEKLLNRLGRKPPGTVTVLGDILLDEYTACTRDYSANEHCVVLRKGPSLFFPGNALNVSLNIAALNGNAAILGALGTDTEADRLRSLAGDRIDSGGLIGETGRQTTLKTRLSDGDGLLLRVDREDNTPLSATVAGFLLKHADSLPSVSCAVLSDLGKGVLPDSLVAGYIRRAADKGIPVLVDPAGENIRRYAHASVLFPNLAEFNKLTSRSCDNPAEAARYAQGKLAEWEIGALVLKAAEEGSYLITAEEIRHVPAYCKEPVCEVGAGDSFLAAFAVGLAHGLPLEESFMLSNASAAVSVSKAYTSTVSTRELTAFIGQLKQRDERRP